jgi:hypothetical protein
LRSGARNLAPSRGWPEQMFRRWPVLRAQAAFWRSPPVRHRLGRPARSRPANHSGRPPVPARRLPQCLFSAESARGANAEKRWESGHISPIPWAQSPPEASVSTPSPLASTLLGSTSNPVD